MSRTNPDSIGLDQTTSPKVAFGHHIDNNRHPPRSTLCANLSTVVDGPPTFKPYRAYYIDNHCFGRHFR